MALHTMTDKKYTRIVRTRDIPNAKLYEAARVRAELELYALGAQESHFAMTGQTWLKTGGRFAEGAFGCVHDDIVAAFPELEKYVKWHLCSFSGPMHYIANAVYHLKEGKIDYAKSSAVYGALPGEDAALFAEKSADINTWEAFLIERIPALRDAFYDAMLELFGDADAVNAARDHAPLQPIPAPLTPERVEARRAERLQREADAKTAARAAIVTAYADKESAARFERDGKLWLHDHDVSAENAIYYSHTRRWAFGWRKKMTDDEKAALLLDLEGFPFPYDVVDPKY